MAGQGVKQKMGQGVGQGCGRRWGRSSDPEGHGTVAEKRRYVLLNREGR